MKQYKIWKHLSIATATALVITACGSNEIENAGISEGLDRIEEYAENGGTAPTVQDYINAGITGITIANLAEINTVVLGLVAEDVDTAEEVQLLVNELGEEVTVPINPNPTPVTEDTTAPSFTSSATASVNENQTSAITLVATDDSNVTYSISGGESGSFFVDASTGVVTFNTAPDFETLATYTFTATATDTATNVSTQDIIITITDVVEGQAPKKTGQAKSYDASGAEVTDGSLKDDGFYQKGTTPSYTRDDATDIVTDHITGLEWQDDVEAKTIEKNWEDAQIYCSGLSLDAGGWRLPSIDELMYIADRSKVSPAIDTNYFKNVSLDNFNVYWSSTTMESNLSEALDVYFKDGSDLGGAKSYSHYVRCVRDRQ